MCTNAEGDVIFIFNNFGHVDIQMSFGTEAVRILPGVGIVQHRVDIN
jgi:hypothetical protein